MKTKTNELKLIERILGNKTEVIKIGLDVHARDVVMCVQEDASLAQRPQRTSSAQVVTVVRALVKAGRKVYACQEAGPCGFGLHRELSAAGAHSYVVVPRTLSDGRRQKTDGLDATALSDALDRYQRGNTKAFATVRVPTPEEEQQRAQSRHRDQLKKSQRQWEARGRSLLLAQDHHTSGKWWSPQRWEKLRSTLPAWLVEQLEAMRTILTTLETQEKKLRSQLETTAPKALPKAIGALTWVLLQREVCDWHRFKNRRQVASYTGLCPGGHQSGGTRRDGHINRHGNPRVRHLLIELIWRLVRWQPSYPPIKGLVDGPARGAARRKLAVAAARKLSVDLWRLATGQTTPENLHLIVPAA
jgi:transposase